MVNQWEDLEDVFVGCAESDLHGFGGVEPLLAAFRGPALQFLAWLRPFEKGAYADPLIELMALAMPLRADRLALCMNGRAWSWEDPIPPVTEDADLRQRALVLTFVDGAQKRVRFWNVLRPYDVNEGGDVAWQDRVHLEGGEGWVGEALQMCVKKRNALPATLTAIRDQAARVEQLGHQLYVSPELMQRLVAIPC